MTSSFVRIIPLSCAFLLWTSLVTVGCSGDGQSAATATTTDSDSSSGWTTEGDDVESDGETDDAVDEADDPGRVTLRRLNRNEYNNTVRDLLWTTQTPADDFAADDIGLGFDNIADVLTLSPLQAELYERAAQTLLEEAMTVEIIEPTTSRREAEGPEVSGSGGQALGEYWRFSSNGEISTAIQLGEDGEYLFQVRAYGEQAGPDFPRMVLAIDAVTVAELDVSAIDAAPEVYSVMVPLAAGAHTFSVAFTNDFYDPPGDRNLLVDWIEVSGPQSLADPSLQRERIFVCDPEVAGEEECGRQILATFGRRAYRRPLTNDELDRLMVLITSAQADGRSFENSLKLALRAILISPHFIFRVEIDPDPKSLKPHPLNDFELATRLSYFLWSSMPDDELLALAAAGELSDPLVVEAQVRRMLEDQKAHALVENFAGQWFLFRGVTEVFHEPEVFPEWTEELQLAMRGEMQAFTSTFFDGDRSMLELLSAEETYVNERLASHYGIEGIEGEDFVQVNLDGIPRQGILTQAGLLSILAHSEQTSVVKRGKFLMENILCISPPPPPPNLDIPELEPPAPGATQRELLEKHREDPICAGCHDIMDPLGFGLEHYDAIGAYRELDNGAPVDASGTIPSGLAFTNGLEMSSLLSQEQNFVECMVRKTFTYSLGRGITPNDTPYFDDIVADFEMSDYRFADLVVSLATSDVFRARRGEPDEL